MNLQNTSKSDIITTLKSLIIWLCFIPIAILNGGFREYVLDGTIGRQLALPISGILLSVCIFTATYFLLPHIGRKITTRNGCFIGVTWTILTAVFEFSAGLYSGISLSGLLAAYNPLSGNLWLIVLATTALSPVIVSRKLTVHDR